MMLNYNSWEWRERWGGVGDPKQDPRRSVGSGGGIQEWKMELSWKGGEVMEFSVVCRGRWKRWVAKRFGC
jgi:hypothetical protein